ncbi:TPA: DNA helicase UvrD, partial [Escherichia coli]|nr:DNA helicase UvrD [Escherichia coli]
MSFIAIESNAVRKIVSERMLQSADYEKGQILADVLKEQKKGDFSIDVKVVTTTSGIYLLTKELDKKRMLVFDTSNFNGFKRNSNEVITILQKSCRLAIKLWDKIGHSPCEKIISGSSLIALLPFSFTTGKSYKVILDKAPD